MCRSDCVLTSWSCPPPVDDRCVHGAGDCVRREECFATAGWLLGRARGPGTDWGLWALSLPPHPPPSHRYPGAQVLIYMHTHNVYMLWDTCFHQWSTTMCHLGLIHFQSEFVKSDIGFGRNENCITLGLNGTWLMPCSCHIIFAVNTSCWMGQSVNVIGSYTLDIDHIRWHTWH